MKSLAFALILSLLAACASYEGRGLRAGASTEAEVRSVMGAPALELASEDGSKRLAYPRGPLGTQTFMADVGRDGVLQAVRPVLNEDTFNRVRPGLTRDEILHLIGPPGETQEFPRQGHIAWDYRYQDTWGYLAIFSVIFDRGGIVVSKFTQRLERDRNRF